MDNPVSKVYSKAFFELSKEKGKLEKHREDLLYISQILGEHPDFKSLVENPNVLKEDKKTLFSKIFTDIENETSNLLNILVDKSRLDIIGDLILDFGKMYNEEFNISHGIVYSVNKLEVAEIKDLQTSLEKKLGKKVELINEIDQSLIGGISVLIDGKRIDNSIKSRLEGLKAHLRKEGE